VAANPNNVNYFLRGGTVWPQYVLGSVAGTADTDYWIRDGVIQFPADIQPSTTTIDGRLAIRAAIVNHRTKARDIDALIAAVLRAGRKRHRVTAARL